VTFDKELRFKVHLADKAGKATSSAGAAQDEGAATQSGQVAGVECGAAGGSPRAGGVVPDRDARHKAAPTIVTENHGAGGDQKAPHRYGVRGRPASPLNRDCGSRRSRSE